MGNLNTSLFIGIQALEATQGAIEATTNNIANSNSPGYTREVAQFSANAETETGGLLTGGGVTLEQLQSVRDDLLSLQIQQQTSQQASADARSSILQQIQTYFSNTGKDLATTFAAFSSSLGQLSANPAGTAAQQSVLAAGQSLASSFNSTANAMVMAQSEADQRVTQIAAQINAVTQQIADLNAQLAQAAISDRNGGPLQDQRDQLVQQLAHLTAISVSESSTGEVITTPGGAPLVMGNQSFGLQTTTGSDGVQHIVDKSGNDITASLGGGQIGGALEMRDQVIPGYLSALNTLAAQFATAFNAAQAQGYDSTGNVGGAFFSLPASGTGAAAGLGVGITSGSQIAISSDGAPGSNGNVANLSAVLTTALPCGQTPADAYASLVFRVGNDASNASAQSAAIGASLLQLANQQSSISGVNLDEETTNLIRFQTAYEAAARVISTIQALSTVTLNMGSAQSY